MDQNRKLTEEELYFYEDKISAEADAVYRFCVGLMLNQDAGYDLLVKTFKRAATDIRSLIGIDAAIDLRAELFAMAFELFDVQKEATAGDSPLFQFLKRLSAVERTVAISRDVCGLSPETVARVVNQPVENIYQISAKTRSELRQRMNVGK